jgi:hypothetical protein
MRNVVITPWSEDEVLRLRLWHADGVSQGEIARRLGRTPSSVHSKCHQLDMPQRERPVPVGQPQPKRAGSVTLPPLPSLRGG